MSEHKTGEIAAELLAILDTYTGEQRARALAEQRRARIALTRTIGEGLQVSYEVNVDEHEGVKEIYDRLAPVDAALDRLKAKGDILDRYGRLLMTCGEIENTMRTLAQHQVKFEAERVARNSGRRVQREEPTDLQKGTLSQIRQSIRELWDRVDDYQARIAECKRVLEGEEPFAVLADQVAGRIAELRGTSERVAA